MWLASLGRPGRFGALELAALGCFKVDLGGGETVLAEWSKMVRLSESFGPGWANIKGVCGLKGWPAFE